MTAETVKQVYTLVLFDVMFRLVVGLFWPQFDRFEAMVPAEVSGAVAGIFALDTLGRICRRLAL